MYTAEVAGYSGDCGINWACKTLKDGATIGFAEGSEEFYTGIKNPTNPAAIFLGLIAHMVTCT